MFKMELQVLLGSNRVILAFFLPKNKLRETIGYPSKDSTVQLFSYAVAEQIGGLLPAAVAAAQPRSFSGSSSRCSRDSQVASPIGFPAPSSPGNDRKLANGSPPRSNMSSERLYGDCLVFFYLFPHVLSSSSNWFFIFLLFGFFFLMKNPILITTTCLWCLAKFVM